MGKSNNFFPAWFYGCFFNRVLCAACVGWRKRRKEQQWRRLSVGALNGTDTRLVKMVLARCRPKCSSHRTPTLANVWNSSKSPHHNRKSGRNFRRWTLIGRSLFSVLLHRCENISSFSHLVEWLGNNYSNGRSSWCSSMLGPLWYLAPFCIAWSDELLSRDADVPLASHWAPAININLSASLNPNEGHVCGVRLTF